MGHCKQLNLIEIYRHRNGGGGGGGGGEGQEVEHYPPNHE